MKKICYVIIFAICALSTVKVHAFSISTNTTAYVNSNIAVKIEATGLTGRFSITSSDENIIAGSDNAKWLENETITMYFTAKNVGKATITVNTINVTDSDYNVYSDSRSITVNVIKKESKPSVDVNKTYSKNNYLKSLSVDDYELTPAFDKDTLEYTIELNPGTESVNVSAVKEDENASIKGIGEISVSEGINTVDVTVTAENGNERIYTIKMNVEEKDPIDVKIDCKNYRVIKKRELIEKIDNCEEVDVNINDIAVPGLYNDVTKVTLIGLKDEEGNIKYCSYNSSTGEYIEYKEFKFDVMSLYITESKKSKYEKTKLTINEIEVPAYKVEGVDDYYLLYGTNTSTGYKGYYLYDKKENSIQRYDSRLLDKVMQEKDKYFNLVLVLSCVCFLTMVFLLIEVNKDNKREI